MALPQESRATFRSLVESGNIRYSVWPAAAVGVQMVSDNAAAAWAWAAYVDIIAAANLVDPSWLCGIHIHTAVVAHHYGEIAVAIGAAGFEVDLAIFPYQALFVGATAVLAAMPMGGSTKNLPYPIRIIGSPRLSGRVRKSSAANLDGVTLKAIVATLIGT